MDYQKLYFHLFNAVTDALEAMDTMRLAAARRILVDAQRQTEELYMDSEEEPV